MVCFPKSSIDFSVGQWEKKFFFSTKLAKPAKIKNFKNSYQFLYKLCRITPKASLAHLVNFPVGVKCVCVLLGV